MKNLLSSLFKSKIFAIIGLSLFSTYASAEVIYCKGKIQASYVTAGGDVIISGNWRGSYTRICNLNQTIATVTPLTCSMWASLASSSLINNKRVILQYSVDNGVSCASLPTYNSAPIPGYFMQRYENEQ